MSAVAWLRWKRPQGTCGAIDIYGAVEDHALDFKWKVAEVEHTILVLAEHSKSPEQGSR